MMRTFTCIVCPNGCEIEADITGQEITSISGASCPKGETYVKQELLDPRRNIATSVLVEGGVLPLASVRLTEPIPKKEIGRAMEAIKKIRVLAPVTAGTVVLSKILGFDSDVIVTKTVLDRESSMK